MVVVGCCRRCRGIPNPMRSVKSTGVFESVALPVVRLLGHALAAGLGFGALALISLIPTLTLRWLIWLGLTELALPLRSVETGLLVADAVLFGVVSGSGMVVFAVESIAVAKQRICAAWRSERE